MPFETYSTILVTEKPGYIEVTLNRPEARNAMNLTMVNELMSVFSAIKDNRDVRAVVLRGAEKTFCAGGDIKDMAKARSEVAEGKSDIDPFYELNRQFGRMISMANAAPQAVIAILEGAVLGGGFGLACISDIAIASKDAKFGLPETGLGIPIAQIAPFVVQRIGLTQARRLGVLGARFEGEEAKRLGIVHVVCETAEQIEEELQKNLKQIFRCAPVANSKTKELMLAVGTVELETLLDRAAEEFSAGVQGPEGREGTKAFVEKRLPAWAEV